MGQSSDQVMNPPSSSVGSQHPPLYPSHTSSTGLPEYHQAAAAAATANAALSQQQQQQQQHQRPPSQHGTPHSTTNPKKRRASGAPGSRGVANLTPEQLAKKRANDREAQRAIRERTKNTIETLEQRIKELEGQQPFQELQRVIQERDRALQECEELRRRLEAVAGIVGSQPPGLNELATLTAQQSPLPPVVLQQPNLAFSPAGASPATYEPQQHIHPDLRSPHPPGDATPTASHASTGTGYAVVDGTPRKRWSPQTESATAAPYRSPTIGRFDPSRSPHTSMPAPHRSGNGERLGVNFLLDSNQQQVARSSHSPNALPAVPYSASQKPALLPAYARVPKNGPSSCTLDQLLNDFCARSRKMIVDGVPLSDVIGPDTPAYGAFAFPHAQPQSPAHPVSALLIDILPKFPDIQQLPEKVAVLYVMFHMLRWSICPCEDCFSRLPDFSRPTPAQVDIAHPTWADYLPWPHMRDQLTRTENEVQLNDFFVPYTKTLSLNWPHPPETVLQHHPRPASRAGTDSSSSSDTVTINPAFERHCRTLSNWSVGAAFRKAFPQLVDASVHVRE